MDDYHARQFDGGPIACDGYNCAAASGAMGLYAGSGGVHRITSDTFRSTSGVSCVPGAHSGSGGLFISDVERVFDRYKVGIDYGRDPGSTAPRRWPADELAKRLATGQGAVLLGNYGALPPAWRAPGTFLGDHSVWVHDVRTVPGNLHWHDPLRSAGLWMPISVAVGYWQSGAVRGFAGFVTIPEVDMLRHRPATSIGTATVKGDGHWTIDPATGKGYKPVAAGTVLKVFGDGWLEKPWPGQPSPTPMLNVQHPGEPFVVYALQTDTDWPRGFVRPGGGDCDDEIAAAVSDERRRAQGHRDAARADLDRI